MASAGSSTRLQVGAEFSTYQDLQDSVTEYQAENFVQLYVRSSRSVESARKRTPKRLFKDDIVYTEVDYACIHGGRRFVSKSKGDRPNQHTYLKACPFSVQVRTNIQGTSLFVKSIHDEHNHPIDKAAFAHLPHQRRLDALAQETAVELIKMKANKKLVQQRILEQTGKIVTLKDLHNIGGKVRPSDDMMALLNEMEKTDSSSVELLVDANNTLQGIFFQKEQWKQTYQQYPEIVFVDATYKLNNLRMPLYVMLVEDGNGESEVICLWFVCNEDRDTISRMTRIFKNHNDTRQTNCVMTDKDMIEREVFAEEFPDAKLLICLFHTLRSMKREITTEKMGITSAQRQTVLQILQQLAYSQGEEEYEVNYELLRKTNLRSVINYFDSNWHDIRDQWVDGLRNDVTHYFNRTNNRLESINQKIKSLVGKFTSLATCFRELMQCISSLSLERDHRAISAFQKRPVYQASTEALAQYQKILTPYAFVKKQHDLVAKVQPLGVDTATSSCTFKGRARDVKTSIFTCSCGIPQSVSLPCRHILALRAILELPLFSEQLYAQRWTLLYYKQSQRVFLPEVSGSLDISVGTPIQKPPRILTQHEKYRHARKLTNQLATLASEIPSREFEYAMECLSCIVNAWEKGQRVVVDIVTTQEDDLTQPSVAVFSSEANLSNSVSLADIKLPSRIKQRGRPKGSALTTIGLPRKKCKRNGPIAFLQLPQDKKESRMLEWLLPPQSLAKFLEDGILDTEDLPKTALDIKVNVLDEDVNWAVVEKFFEKGAWLRLCGFIALLKKEALWFCTVCSKNLESDASIVCKACLSWYHITCAGLKSRPKRRLWYCRKCHEFFH